MEAAQQAVAQARTLTDAATKAVRAGMLRSLPGALPMQGPKRRRRTPYTAWAGQSHLKVLLHHSAAVVSLGPGTPPVEAHMRWLEMQRTLGNHDISQPTCCLSGTGVYNHVLALHAPVILISLPSGSASHSS